MKKVSTALIAMIMVMVMGFSSFAGSITLKEVENGKTYDLYRIFELTGKDTDDPVNGEFDLYSYTIDPDWVDFFIGTDAPGKEFLVKKEDPDTVPAEYADCNELTYEDPSGERATYFMNINDDNVADLSQKALSYSVELTPDDSKEALADGDLKFDEIPLGYYLVYPRGASDIKDTYASICSLESTTPDGSIEIKATYPSIEKEVDDASAEVGQTVTFTVKGQVPDTTGYEAYEYTVEDTMDPGLTFNDDVDELSVVFGTDAITVPDTEKGTSYAIAGNGFKLTFDMTKYQAYKGQDITITYKAVVNDNAVVTLTENHAELSYSNDPKHATDSEYVTTNPPEEAEVYSSQIKVIKTDNASPSEKLADAIFSLISATPSEAGKDRFYKYTAASGTTPAKVEWVEDINEATQVPTNEDGEAYFKGLEDGTYYLHEIKAPAGYSLLDHDVEIIVAGKADGDGKMVGVTVDQPIINVPGKKLPATGGTGTTILYIIGGILVVGAGILLITKKRIESEE